MWSPTNGLGMTKAHKINVVFGVVHTAHHALVISEEEDGKTSQAVDGDEKLPFLKLVGDVPLSDLVAHGG